MGYIRPMFTSRPNPSQAAYPLPCAGRAQGQIWRLNRSSNHIQARCPHEGSGLFGFQHRKGM